jgi:BTB/POZ domain-containing protein KCTD8/12/16
MASSTITFDVGGKIYRVSQSLVASYPDTMLAKMSSETWAKKDNTTNNHEEQPIYIDCDSERFGYVLDYMRDGLVHFYLRGYQRKNTS